jgi:3-methylfumaryl-CoA hydratase
LTENGTEARFDAWLGRQETAEDILTPRLVSEFRATLGLHLADQGPAVAPLMIHWCLCPTLRPGAELGEDGHPAKGGFLPPVPLPRRMWAAGELTFHDDLLPGDEVQRTSTIISITPKTGRTGNLCFVDVGHNISTKRGLAIQENQTIVYREARNATPAAPKPNAMMTADGDVAVDFFAIDLFRYSAMTFNGHRIHYDAPYATAVEGYAGLVVHGPLQATLLAHVALARQKRIARFGFRGLSALIGPTSAIMRVTVEPQRLLCRMLNPSGAVTTEAWVS